MCPPEQSTRTHLQSPPLPPYLPTHRTHSLDMHDERQSRYLDMNRYLCAPSTSPASPMARPPALSDAVRSISVLKKSKKLNKL